MRLTRAKICSFWHDMLKIALVSGAPPQTPWGSLRRSPNPLVGRGFLPSAITPSQGLPPLEIKSGYAPAIGLYDPFLHEDLYFPKILHLTFFSHLVYILSRASHN